MWHRCVAGGGNAWKQVNEHQEWTELLAKTDAWNLRSEDDDRLILRPLDNTDYLNDHTVSVMGK